MPDAVVTWIQALVKHRRAVLEIDRGPAQPQEAAEKEDPVLAALERRHQRLAALRKMLMDRKRTSFALVTVPERLVIEETARAAEMLGEAGVDVGGLIVNRVLPDGLEGEFYRSRKAQEHDLPRGDRAAVPKAAARPGPPAPAGRLRPGVAGARQPADAGGAGRRA